MILADSSYNPSGTPAAPTPISNTSGLGVYNGPVMDSSPQPTPNLGAGTTTGGVFTPSNPNQFVNTEYASNPNPQTTNPSYPKPAAITAGSGLNNSFGQGANGYSGGGGGSGSSGGTGGPFPLQGQYGIVKMANGGLAAAAQQVRAQGRNNDTQLMHVTPGELRGLQALAMAHGGSLTINPRTGLPEAGFLEDVLPVAAAGAMMFIAPEFAPLIGEGLGLGTGALGTGVGMGLLAGGTQAVGQLLGSGKVDLNSVLRTGLLSGATAGAMQGFMGAPSTAEVPTSNVQTPVPAVNAAMANQPDAAIQAANAAKDPIGAMNASQKWTDPWNTAYDKVATDPSQSWWGSLSPGQKMATGLGGVTLLSLLGQSQTPKITPMSTTTPMIRPYTYNQTRNPLWGQPGQPYFNQSYTAGTPYAAAQGGLMESPAPGAVERMSMGNQMYPMSQMDKTQYATPSQMPTSAEVVNADYDSKTNAYTGEPTQRFAAGGQTLNPVSQDVLDYQKVLENRARDEYVNGPQLAAFRSAPVTNVTPTPNTLLPITNQGLTLAGGIPNQFIYTPGQGYTTNPAYTEYMNENKQDGISTVGMIGTMNPGLVERWNELNGYKYNPAQYSGGKAGGLMQSYRSGGKADDDFELSDESKDAIKYQLMLNSLSKRPGEDPSIPLPQGVVGRAGLSKLLDDNSSVRAGLSGLAMALPGQHGVRTMPGSIDIGYRSPTKSDYDPYLDLSAYRSINPIPGRGHAQGVNASYTIPFVEGGQTGYNLGGYSDGGRLLKGPGDGMSDNIPATIGHKQPARLADGEFVVPADVVSHLGNGSTDAGAKRLYAMMDKVRMARVGTKKQGKQIKADKYLPK